MTLKCHPRVTSLRLNIRFVAVWIIAAAAVLSLWTGSGGTDASIDRIYTLPFYSSVGFECHFDGCYPGHKGNDYQLGNVSAGGEVVAAALGGKVDREFQPGPDGAGYFIVVDHLNTHMTRYLHSTSF
jgi:murein DD-endopeptidase MepM/ murein hydrolase activator NlpD